MTDEGKGLRRGGKQRRYPSRLPPVVSSLFSRKAAHWRDGIRGTELGARGKGADGEEPRYPRKGLRLTRRGIEDPESRFGESSTSRRMRVRTSTTAHYPLMRQAGALALQWDFRSSILSYSILFAHALCFAPRASSRPGDEAELVVLL
jgi:hypothetical protein